MKKFLSCLMLLLLHLSTVKADVSLVKKRYFSVPATIDPCKAESVQYWNLLDFPFMESIKFTFPYSTELVLAPTTVRWPMAAIQNQGTISCSGMGSIAVSVEVFLAGITDADPNNPGANINCVVHLGRVSAFGGSPCDITPVFQCVTNYNMTYAGMDNAGFDVFTSTINNLPPGIYEYTCACSDNGPIADPLTHPAGNIRWIGQEACPATNAFVNGRVTVNGAVANDDCTGALTATETTQAANNLCSADGKVWYAYTVTDGDLINVSVSPNTVTNPRIYQIRLNSCVGTVIGSGPALNIPLTCLTVGDVFILKQVRMIIIRGPMYVYNWEHLT